MNKVNAVAVDEVGKPRRTADTSNRADFLVGNLKLFQNFEKSSQNSEISATRTPRWVVRREVFLGQFFGLVGRGGHGSNRIWDSGGRNNRLNFFNNFTHFISQTVSFADRSNLRITVTGAQQRGELATAV